MSEDDKAVARIFTIAATPFALMALMQLHPLLPFVGMAALPAAWLIRQIVRDVNHRDDPRHAKAPPDLPDLRQSGVPGSNR